MKKGKNSKEQQQQGTCSPLDDIPESMHCSADDSNMTTPRGILAIGEAFERMVIAGSTCSHDSIVEACKAATQGGAEWNEFRARPTLSVVEDLQFRTSTASWEWEDDSTIMTTPTLRAAMMNRNKGKVVLTGDKKLRHSDPQMYEILRKYTNSVQGKRKQKSTPSVVRAPSRKNASQQQQHQHHNERKTQLPPRDLSSHAVALLDTAKASCSHSDENLSTPQNSRTQPQDKQHQIEGSPCSHLSRTSPVSVSQFPLPRPPNSSPQQQTKQRSTSSASGPASSKEVLVRIKSVQEVDLKPCEMTIDESQSIEIGANGEVITVYEERGFEFQERFESRHI